MSESFTIIMNVAPWQQSTWTLPPLCRWTGWTEQLAHDLQAAPCVKLACMINIDLVAICNVSGSHQLGRVLHEMITFSVLGERLQESLALCCESEAGVENCVLSF